MVDWDDLLQGPVQAVFGEPVAWQSSQLPAPVMVSGGWSDGFRPLSAISGDDGYGPVHVTASSPMLGVQLSQFPVPPLQNDLVTVRGKTYRINEVQADGFGAARLELVNADQEYDPLPRRNS